MARLAQAGFSIALALGTTAQALPPDQAEFFEKKIRPVLTSECLECHGAEKQKGGLRLDFRDGWKKGGDTGAAIAPGEPSKSLLMRAIRHEDPEMEMPAKRPKLSDTVIADLERWIATGAPDPRDEPSKETAVVPWDALLADRKNWWSLQPVRNLAAPATKNAEWSQHPVDQFLLAKMETAGIAPGIDADARAFCRRATFILTGLPPKAEEVEAFARECEAEQSATGRVAKCVDKLIDRLLAAPQFGERWARHWMDLVRYAESHGSEGDPEIPHAWRYRDYLIRAFNDDLPLNQLIREHLAGDLIPKPRWNAAEGWNESMLGIAHLRLVEHGFQPVDTRDEQVKVVESQIDVLGKAFQGMTFACARCHDHKFDAVSQRDYYALAGIFESSRPALVTIDSPEVLNHHRDELAGLKVKVKSALVDAWLAECARIPERLLNVNARAAEIAGAKERLAGFERAISQLDDIARVRVLAKRGVAQPGGKAAPMPIARWDFETPRAQLANLDGHLQGDAELSGGRLKLRGNGYLQTAPLARSLREKTLEAWVSLSTVDQAGGGVFAVEDSRGNVFDALVFAEKDPLLWVAGSDLFTRSARLKGPPAKAGDLVHLALSYRADGETTLFRNGTPYGQPWRAVEAPVLFAPDARVLFGLRHTLGEGNGYLRGEIEEARLYDRALTGEEARASLAAGFPLAAVSAEELFSARSAEEIAERGKLGAQLAAAQLELERLAPKGKDPWSEALAAARKQPESVLRGWVSAAKPAASESGFTAGPALKFHHGPGIAPVTRGDFAILAEGQNAIGSLLPAGVASGLLTRKHGGIAATPWFRITTDFISFRAAGRDAQIRFMLDGYPLGNGQIFPRATLNHDDTRWVTIDVKYRKEAWAYIEVATAEDLTRQEKNDAPRSWFAVETIAMHDGPAPVEKPAQIAGFDPRGAERERAEAFASAVKSAVLAWRDGCLTEDQRALLDELLRKDLLPAGADLPSIKTLVAEFRRLEGAIPIPRRATGVVEADHADAPFLTRGDHHKVKGTVPRGYLEIFGAGIFSKDTSGRLQLADAILDPANPLTARVLVNRLWLSVFGRGLVATPDNFGKMGEQPSHPELLDYLAARFVENRWSAKSMLRLLLTTRAAQLSTTPTKGAAETDAENRLLSYYPLRRLEAEAIRDSLLALSGALDLTPYGPPVAGNAPRRSIYVGIRRTNLNPFLQTFDAPKPFTTIGRRDSTNVPAQSLTLLNDPFVIRNAEQWAGRVLIADSRSTADRVKTMFLAALSRPPTVTELHRCEQLIAISSEGDRTGQWGELAQAIFNLKEFVYLR